MASECGNNAPHEKIAHGRQFLCHNSNELFQKYADLQRNTYEEDKANSKPIPSVKNKSVSCGGSDKKRNLKKKPLNVLPNYFILHENDADKPLIASKDEFCLKEYALAVLKPSG